MIKSMTAFARSTIEGQWGSITVEIRTVNHRYLDASLRLPDAVKDFEAAIREEVAKYVSRGKLELTLKFTPGAESTQELAVNMEVVDQLIKAAEAIQSRSSHLSPLDTVELLRWPNVLKVPSPDLSILKEKVLAVVGSALEKLIEMRAQEGIKLQQFLLERLSEIKSQVDTIVPQLPKLVEQQRAKFLERAKNVGVSFDEERLEQELVIYAQKIDVQEELDRLFAHVAEVERILRKEGAVGRRLDFLMQELNREANTLGSKSVATSSSHVSVDLKVLIEQMREQIQNIE